MTDRYEQDRAERERLVAAIKERWRQHLQETFADLHARLADAFCSNGFCGGDTSSAPCERARQAASVAMDVLHPGWGRK